jgi:hypothetical protein
MFPTAKWIKFSYFKVLQIKFVVKNVGRYVQMLLESEGFYLVNWMY